MKKSGCMIKKVAVVLLLAFFSSCESVQGVRGVVVDADTRLPIEGVMVYEVLYRKTPVAPQSHADSVESCDGVPVSIWDVSGNMTKYYKVTEVAIDSLGSRVYHKVQLVVVDSSGHESCSKMTSPFWTDSLGHFSFMHMVPVLPCGAPEFTLYFVREGYLPVTMTYEEYRTDSTMVFMKRKDAVESIRAR